MPPDPLPSVGGPYAKRRRGDTTSREFAGDDGVNRARIHGAAPPFRARVGGLSAGPHDRWAPPYEPTLQYLQHVSFTHDSRQTALHSDVYETESYSGSARSALWDVAIACQ